jgi:hypothetical protein
MRTFYQGMSRMGSVSDWSAIISAGSAVALTVTAWLQLGGLRKQIKAANAQTTEARTEAKIERTLATCSRYESDVVIERCVRRLRGVYDAGTYPQQALRLKHELVMVLNYLDSIAIGFEQQLYLEDMAKDHIASIVRMYYEQYMDRANLKALGIDPNNYSSLYQLAEKWGKPVPGFRADDNRAGNVVGKPILSRGARNDALVL